MRAEQIEVKFAPLLEMRRIEGVKKAINLRLVRETSKSEDLSESRFVIAKMVVDLDGMIATDDQRGPDQE